MAVMHMMHNNDNNQGISPSLYAGPEFITNVHSYQYRKSYCEDKLILQPSYCHHHISYTVNTMDIELGPTIFRDGICITTSRLKLFWQMWFSWLTYPLWYLNNVAFNTHKYRPIWCIYLPRWYACLLQCSQCQAIIDRHCVDSHQIT